MAKTVKLSDKTYGDLSRVKRNLSLRHNREVTLGEAVEVVLEIYKEVLAAIGGIDETTGKDN